MQISYATCILSVVHTWMSVHRVDMLNITCLNQLVCLRRFRFQKNLQFEKATFVKPKVHEGRRCVWVTFVLHSPYVQQGRQILLSSGGHV